MRNMQNLNLEVEKIKDISDYNPDGTKDWAALKDDARICAGWYATFLDPDKEIKFSEAEIIAVAIKVYREIARCKKLDPEKYKYTADPADMTLATKKLWEKVKKKLSKTQIDILLKKETGEDAKVEKKEQGKDQEETAAKEEEEGGDKYAEVKPSGDEKGREITAKEVLEKFESFLLRKPFLYLVGGLANNGTTTGDIDILVKAGPDLPESFKIPLEFRIYRMFAQEDRSRVHILYDLYQGPFTTHYELADLKIDNREGPVRVEMSRDLDGEEGGRDTEGLEEIEKGLDEEGFPEEFIEKARFFLEVQKAEFGLTGKEGVAANREAKQSMRQNRIVMNRRFYPQKTSVSAMMAYRKQETYSVSQTLAYLQKLHERGIR